MRDYRQSINGHSPRASERLWPPAFVSWPLPNKIGVGCQRLDHFDMLSIFKRVLVISRAQYDIEQIDARRDFRIAI